VCLFRFRILCFFLVYLRLFRSCVVCFCCVRFSFFQYCANRLARKNSISQSMISALSILQYLDMVNDRKGIWPLKNLLYPQRFYCEVVGWAAGRASGL